MAVVEPKQLNVKVSPDLIKELGIYCANNSMTKKEVVEKALAAYMANKPTTKK